MVIMHKAIYLVSIQFIEDEQASSNFDVSFKRLESPVIMLFMKFINDQYRSLI
jgi:hypothetical protein